MITNKASKFRQFVKSCLPFNIYNNSLLSSVKPENQKFYFSENTVSPLISIDKTSTSKTKYKGLYISDIRRLNIGNNYFRHINPKRKKILMTLLNSYIKNFKSEKFDGEIKQAFDLFYNNKINGKNFQDATGSEYELSETLLWHLEVIMLMERISSQYSRFEFLEYDKIIKILNAIPKEKRNRAKFVFTSHPTQPNSIDQLDCIAEIVKGLEENDLSYVDYKMAELIKSNRERVFKKPSYLEESIAYHRICIANMIMALSNAYELGLKDPGSFIEIPGTWLTFDFDNHPEMSTGLMTYTHGFNLKLTIDQYLKIISESETKEELSELINMFEKVKAYGDRLMDISNKYRSNKISKHEFFERIPIFNLYGIVSNISKFLKEKTHKKINENTCKLVGTCKKLNVLFDVFGVVGCLGQVRLSGEDLLDKSNVQPIISDIIKEISILNSNGTAADMIIIANYEFQKQYELVKSLMDKFQLINVEIVPLLETFSASNDTDSKITMIASSDTRQRDGLLLTELRTLREYKKNPDKIIYMGQGVTAERGGGPYKILHQKFKGLTKVQRQRHIRTVQGHYFTSEFISRDLSFTFLLNCALYINQGQDFEPTQDYMDFLFELDNVVGVPQREMQKTEDFNNFYVKNIIVKNLVESFTFAGSREMGKPLEKVKKQRAIVQAYINSDRCSFTHPELAFWDRLNEEMIKKMAKYYYDDNKHFKYILYNYGFMIERYNLEFAKQEVGLNHKSNIFQSYERGKHALKNILNSFGLISSNNPLVESYNQHIGLLANSSEGETNQKFQAYKSIYILQNYYVRKFVKEKTTGVDTQDSEKKMKILQSTLANISEFNGKG